MTAATARVPVSLNSEEAQASNDGPDGCPDIGFAFDEKTNLAYFIKIDQNFQAVNARNRFVHTPCREKIDGTRSYYKDHWVEIEKDRLDRHEQMFQWGPAFERFLTPADIKPSQIVGDLGCGPGFLSCELLRKFAPNGRVHAFNVNKDFSEHTHAKARPRAWVTASNYTT